MAKVRHVIRIQNARKDTDVYETNDGNKADEIVDREIKKAESVDSQAQAIFWNDSLVWRRRHR